MLTFEIKSNHKYSSITFENITIQNLKKYKNNLDLKLGTISPTYIIFNYHRSVPNNNAIHAPSHSRPKHSESFPICKLGWSNVFLMETEVLWDTHFWWIKYRFVIMKKQFKYFCNTTAPLALSSKIILDFWTQRILYVFFVFSCHL